MHCLVGFYGDFPEHVDSTCLHLEDLASEWLTVTRMLFSGIILLGVSAISHREEMTAVWKNKKDAIKTYLICNFWDLPIVNICI